LRGRVSGRSNLFRQVLSLGKVNFLEIPKNLKRISFLDGSREGNLAVQKDFLLNFGSNFLLKDRSLLFSKRKPFDLVEKRASRSMWLGITGRLSDYFRGSPEVEIQKFLTSNAGSARLRSTLETPAAAAASSPECRSS